MSQQQYTEVPDTDDETVAQSNNSNSINKNDSVSLSATTNKFKRPKTSEKDVIDGPSFLPFFYSPRASTNTFVSTQSNSDYPHDMESNSSTNLKSMNFRRSSSYSSASSSPPLGRIEMEDPSRGNTIMGSYQHARNVQGTRLVTAVGTRVRIPSPSPSRRRLTTVSPSRTRPGMYEPDARISSPSTSRSRSRPKIYDSDGESRHSARSDLIPSPKQHMPLPLSGVRSERKRKQLNRNNSNGRGTPPSLGSSSKSKSSVLSKDSESHPTGGGASTSASQPGTPSSTQIFVGNGSLKETISNLSFFFSDDSDSEHDQNHFNRFRRRNSQSSTVGNFSITNLNSVSGIKRALFVLTLVFVTTTIFIRSWNNLHPNPSENSSISSSTSDDSTSLDSDVDFRNNNNNNDNTYLWNDEVDSIMALKKASSADNVRNGAVASDDVRCSNIGIMVMRELGGNAMDSAVTTTLCLGVVNPASSGLGGGAFILAHSTVARRRRQYNSVSEEIGESGIQRNDTWPGHKPVPFEDATGNNNNKQTNSTYSKPKKTEVIDCRETAPGLATYDMFTHSDDYNGALEIAVPGELRGLELAWERHGSLSWADVVRPAAEMAERGVIVSKHLASDIQNNAEKIFANRELARTLTRNNDGETLLREGDIMIRREYARTLRKVMIYGSDYLYSGDVAEALANEIWDAGGIITGKDIKSYLPVLRDPVIAKNVFGMTMVGVPPPSSGGATVLGAARFLNGYSDSPAAFSDTLTRHRFVEACKHVFAIRMSLADPKFDGVVTREAVNDLIEGDYMDMLRNETLDCGVLPLSKYGGPKWAQLSDIDGDAPAKDDHEGDRRRLKDNDIPHYNEEQKLDDPSKRDRSNEKYKFKTQEKRKQTYLRHFGYLEDQGTTHLSVVDKNRNSVAITSTINIYFGSGIASPSTGIIFNNEMNDFATPGKVNFYGLNPSEANYIKAGKRPLSSMSPTLIFRPGNNAFPQTSPNKTCAAQSQSENTNDLGQLVMALGASGGPKIITSVLQVFLNHAIIGMPLYSSIAYPRIHDQLLYHGAAATTYDNCTLLQGPTILLSSRTRTALSTRGHDLLSIDYLGTCQAIAADLETGLLTAVSDPRKVGKSAGY